jgi:hypothetical protein
MPRPKKHPKEWTTEEAMKRLFPKKVRDEAKKIASPPSSPARTPDKPKSK